MAEALSVRDAVSAEEALTVLQCLHCGLCEEVCQTRLPLRDCYDVLEGLITDRYGSADDRPTEFSKKVDENRDLIIGRFGIEPSSGPGVGAGGLTEWNASGRGDE